MVRTLNLEHRQLQRIKSEILRTGNTKGNNVGLSLLGITFESENLEKERAELVAKPQIREDDAGSACGCCGCPAFSCLIDTV
jgi:hypothetical protein